MKYFKKQFALTQKENSEIFKGFVELLKNSRVSITGLFVDMYKNKKTDIDLDFDISIGIQIVLYKNKIAKLDFQFKTE